MGERIARMGSAGFGAPSAGSIFANRIPSTAVTGRHSNIRSASVDSSADRTPHKKRCPRPTLMRYIIDVEFQPAVSSGAVP